MTPCPLKQWDRRIARKSISVGGHTPGLRRRCKRRTSAAKVPEQCCTAARRPPRASRAGSVTNWPFAACSSSGTSKDSLPRVGASVHGEDGSNSTFSFTCLRSERCPEHLFASERPLERRCMPMSRSSSMEMSTLAREEARQFEWFSAADRASRRWFMVDLSDRRNHRAPMILKRSRHHKGFVTRWCRQTGEREKHEYLTS